MITPLSVAKSFKGTAEVAGPEDNPQILAWLRAAGWRVGGALHDEVPWCGAFVTAVAKISGCPVPQLPLRARSWLTVGDPVVLDGLDSTGWLVAVIKQDLDDPGPTVLDCRGHVAFVEGWIAEKGSGLVGLIGGNQSNAVSHMVVAGPRILGIRRWKEAV